MAIDISSEELIPLSKVPDLAFVPSRRAGKKTLNTTTVCRWARRGLRPAGAPPDAERVRLETLWCGASQCTTIRALQEFFTALSGNRDGLRMRRTRTRTTAHRRAARRLAAAGIIDSPAASEIAT